MSEGCEAKPWPLPKQASLEAPNDATIKNSTILKENMKVESNMPSKAVEKKPSEKSALSMDEKGAHLIALKILLSGEINGVFPTATNAVPIAKGTEGASMAASKDSNGAMAASGKELKRGGEQLPENSVLQASARPIVIPIHKIFSPVQEGTSHVV
jgi:hypothetical protein